MKEKNNKKLNVHVIVKYFFPVTAGIETNVMETYTLLQKNGWNITIHTSKDTATEKNCLPSREVLRGLSVERYEFNRFGFFPKLSWEKADVLCLHNFDIFPHLLLLLYCFYLKILGKKQFALILTPHGGFNPEWSIFSLLQRTIKKTYHYTIGTFLINSVVDGVRAVSLWERSEMIGKGIQEKKISVIENGIEDEAYMDVEKKASTDIKKRVKEYGKYIIQIGRIYPIKNLETTIKAMTKVPKDIKFIIAGPQDHVLGKDTYKKELDTLIQKLGLQKRVVFAGVVRGVDKYFLIKKAQMMVHMALWESFCNVVHEGLSQGLVCLVANNTALPYLIKDGVNGYCIDTRNWEKVAGKINFVLQNKKSELIQNMKKKNREYGLKNSWEQVADSMYQFYANTLIAVHGGKI